MNAPVFPLDYYVNITLSDDKLNAFIHFTNYHESVSFSSEQLLQLIRSQYIVCGIRQDVLEQMASDPRQFQQSQTLVAEGTAPVNGADGYIKYLFDLDGVAKKPLELEDGTVDFKEVTTIHNVRKGEKISERFLAEEGVNGQAVTGEVLFAKKGKEVRFKVGKNVVLDAEQMNMYAAIDGMVTKTDNNKINVFPIYEVNGDVDYAIGNIDFIGSVVIRGNVLSGFKVKASGDIRITGGIEAAELEAGGSIEVAAGILGQNKGIVRAGRNVKCSFIQDGHVEAGEDVTVMQSIMHSTIRAGRNVMCGGTKGLIVGGLIQAGEKVSARTVGNTMSTNTVIEVGVVPQLRNELMDLRNRLRFNIENMDKTEKALSLLDQLAAAGQLSPDKVAMRVKLGHTKKQAFEEQTEMKERILEIELSLEDTDKAQVKVTSVIYSGAKVVMGRYTKFVKDSVSRVHFKIVDGDIAMLPNT